VSIDGYSREAKLSVRTYKRGPPKMARVYELGKLCTRTIYRPEHDESIVLVEPGLNRANAISRHFKPITIERKSLRILHVSGGQVSILSDTGGGTEKYILSTAKGQAELGHIVTIVEASRNGDEHKEVNLEGLRIIKIKSLASNFLLTYTQRVASEKVRQLRSVIGEFLFGLSVRKWLGQNPTFDFVHFHHVFVGAALLPMNRNLQLRAVFTQHGISYQWKKRIGIGSLYQLVRIFVMRHVAVIIALNPSAKSQFLREAGSRHRSIVFVPAGIHVSHVPRAEPDDLTKRYKLAGRIILTVGRISPEKSLEDAINAIDILVNKKMRKDLVFVIVGPKERFDATLESTKYFRKLLEQIDKCGLRKFIRFVGRISDEELLTLYSLAEIFVLTSRIETLPRVVAEAMSFGKPVVASRLAGTSVLVEDGKSGFLVEPSNHEELAERIGQLLNDKELARQMGSQGKLIALRDFNEKSIAAKITEAYMTVESLGEN